MTHYAGGKERREKRVKTELTGSAQPCSGSVDAGFNNTRPLISEIHDALAVFCRSGQQRVIDLAAIPFGPGDEARLFEALGQGEVTALLDSLGESRISETGFAGVWRVEHFNPQGERVAHQIEITDVPAILRSQPQEMAESAERLAQLLD